MKILLTRVGGGGALGLKVNEDVDLGSREKGSISLKGNQGANFALEDKGTLGSKGSEDAVLGLKNFGWASKTRHSETPQAGSESVNDIGSRRSFQSLAMTCIEDKGERSGLYSNSVSNTTDTSPCHYEEIADFRRNPMTAFSLAHCGERVGMRGFTLAEVLITLGIIGVVAALTIPTLMQKIDERETVSKLRKAFSTLSEAWNQMQLEHGTIDKWGLTNTHQGMNPDGTYITNMSGPAIIGERLKPYLKIQKVCPKNETCNGIKAQEDNTVFILSDGTTMSVGWYVDMYKADFITIKLNADSGIEGKNRFNFIAGERGVLPEGAPSGYAASDFDLNTCMSNGRGCTAWVIYNENMDYLHCDDLSWDGKTKCD